ncbi:uncharacterized protein FA14DRAFT_152175 [Meira miltonrushii]|uniref:Rrn9 domain-containing protein n=1 Tax=Meira miltonrushii TaxID=1280837 RepID=A0A316VGV5_9BASI|nr:uncharacterized protein FA14DRAFT_152175 [Meira miltonrushii]PWN36750.1 hypothetical protein FA14DRAFT_152175 [Meira miltonrushii]
MEDSLPQSWKPHILKPEDYDELKALISSIQEEKNGTITHPLAARIHLERLVERYWERKAQEQQRENDQDEVTPEAPEEEEEEEESLEELRLRILQHPVYATVPTVFRWPILTSQLVRPEWSLADEVMVILTKQSVRASRSSHHSNTEEDTAETLTEDQEESQPPPATQSETVEHPSLDGEEDEIPPSFALPIINQCQTSLQALLESLSDRIPIGRGNGQKRMQRRDIITWRDVLKSVKSLLPPTQSPEEVVQRIEERMHAIAGSATVFPSAAVLTNLGREQGALAKVLRKQAPILTHQSENAHKLFPHNDQTKKRRALQNRLREMDQDLFLSPDRFRHSLLQPSPSEQNLYKRQRF